MRNNSPVSPVLFHILLGLRAEPQDAEGIVHRLRALGQESEPPLASFYRALKRAIDEGYLVGTHTGSLRLPDGQSVPATGKSVRIRGCDAATVQNGRVTSHRFYFDQMEFLGQLELAPEA